MLQSKKYQGLVMDHGLALALIIFPLLLGLVLAATSTSRAAEQEFLDPFAEWTEAEVETPTRAPQPLSQVAENVTIITSKDIREMNAHSVAEVLDRVAGLDVGYRSKDFAPDATLSIHGSKYEQVLILVDGMRYNKVVSGINYTGTIPVQIIDRIEVIRGPASSTWGSALGGIINVITKDPVTTAPVSGMVSGSYGESSSTDLRTELSGTSGRVGYFLYGGHQQSDGILTGHAFDNDAVFAKVAVDLPASHQLTTDFSHSRPQGTYIYDEEWDWQETNENHDQYYTVDLTGTLGPNLSYALGHSRIDDQNSNEDCGIIDSYLWSSYLYDTSSEEVTSQLVWQPSGHSVVLGADYLQAEQTDNDLLAAYALPTTFEENRAIYLNDTITLGQWALIPGLRYDNHSIAQEVVSPSLGAIYHLTTTTLLRAQVGRGFTKPPMNLKAESYGYHGINANPELQQETTWSSQAGIESTAWSWFLTKVTFFDHETDELWVLNYEKNIYENSGENSRKGFEAELHSASWHHLSSGVNFTFFTEEPSGEEAEPQYSANILSSYNDLTNILQLSGHYVWYNKYQLAEEYYPSANGTTIWNLAYTRTLPSWAGTATDLFCNLHNIFNGSQYYYNLLPNAERWAEIGLRLSF